MKKKELQKLIQLAKDGNIVAQSNLGCHYILDFKDDASNAEGIAWLQKSADGGFPPASHHLGICYLQGTGVKADYYKAYDLFDEATKWPDPIPEEWNIKEDEVLTVKGISYLNKSVTAMLLSYSSAILDMIKAAEFGEKRAIAYLATLMSTDGRSLNTDYLSKAYEADPILAARVEGLFLYNNGHEEEGLEKLLIAAKGGDMLAADTVINNYAVRHKIQTKEEVLLLEELLPFASLKTAESLVGILSSCYFNGIIVEKAPNKGIDLFLSIADRGSVLGALTVVFFFKSFNALDDSETQKYLHNIWKVIEPRLDSKEITEANTGIGILVFAEAFHYGKYGFDKNEQIALKLYKLALDGLKQMRTNMDSAKVKQFANSYLKITQTLLIKLYYLRQKHNIQRNIKQIEKHIHEKTE